MNGEKEVLQKESSIATDVVARPQNDQFALPTWAVIIGLVLFFVLLKTLIYIKDDKRHGK